MHLPLPNLTSTCYSTHHNQNHSPCVDIIPLKFLNFQFQPFGTEEPERDTPPWQQFNLPRRNFICNFLFLFLIASSCLHATGIVGDRRTLAPIPALARGSAKKKKWDSMDGWDIEKSRKRNYMELSSETRLAWINRKIVEGIQIERSCGEAHRHRQKLAPFSRHRTDKV